MNLSIASSPGNKSRMFKVLCPIERKDGKTFWMRVGSAFTNKDLSVNIHLDVLPANLKLQVREFDEDDLQTRGKRRDDADGASRSTDAPPF
jgi:hypothetical protein